MMTKSLSLYFDGFRGVAALAVFFSHSVDPGITGGFLIHLGLFGDDAVVAFFVLSGYVIAFSAEHKHDTLGDYVVARLSRLWSVVLPALLLTASVDYLVGHRMHFNSMHVGEDAPISYALSAIFANQIWFLRVFPGSNSPFWSLSFEAFYYMFFAAAYYLAGTARWLAAIVILAVAGPKIILLLPLWLLGVLAYEIDRHSIDRNAGWWLWIASFVGLALYYLLHAKYAIGLIVPTGERLDQWLNPQLCAKYLFAILVFMNILGFKIIGDRFARSLTLAQRWLRLGGRYSFSLYLYHMPLLILFTALTWSGHGKWWSIAAIYIGTISIVAALAPLTESRKDALSAILKRLGVYRARRMEAHRHRQNCDGEVRES
jgi:peptidoglycan/LPS O-acetylase OafA/YrhL